MARAPQENGEVAVVDGTPPGERPVELALTLEEARGLMELASSTLLAASENGAEAPGGVGAKSAVTKLRESLEEIQKIAAVRAELEQAGFHTQHLSDDEVADLGRRIAEIPQRNR
jgi:hypothetical protein